MFRLGLYCLLVYKIMHIRMLYINIRKYRVVGISLDIFLNISSLLSSVIVNLLFFMFIKIAFISVSFVGSN